MNTRRTFKTTDDRGTEFEVTRYEEGKKYISTNVLYIAEVGGKELRANTLKQIKTLAAQVG